MAKCENCHNEYDKTFDITMNEEMHTFDCFECAIHKLAPRCGVCETPVIGHGLEANGVIFCCGHCSSMASSRRNSTEADHTRELQDRA